MDIKDNNKETKCLYLKLTRRLKLKQASLPVKVIPVAVLDAYFPRLLTFFYPHLYEKIDWKKGYQFLDKELQAITREAAVGKRCVDKLVRVNSCDGQQTVVLLHLEIQGQHQSILRNDFLIITACFICVTNYRLLY